MLERLWNGWRATYVSSGVPETDDVNGQSVFSRILSSGLSDLDTNIVHRSTHCFVVLNTYPYSVGHLLVVPYRQVADLELLTPDESADLWALVTTAVTTIKSAYSPQGVNVGLNLGRPAGGSVSEHLHVHVVPRWTGDSNFMTAVANTRMLPEALVDTASRLRAAWPIAEVGPRLTDS